MTVICEVPYKSLVQARDLYYKNPNLDVGNIERGRLTDEFQEYLAREHSIIDILPILDNLTYKIKIFRMKFSDEACATFFLLRFS
jgi:hypothetical protein